MIVEKVLRRLLHQLVKEDMAQITLGNSEVSVHVFDHETKIYLSSVVYFGNDFISKSVRECLTHTPPFVKEIQSDLSTYLTVDDENYRVLLNYIGGLAHLNKRMFVDVLEEFSWLADEWRLYLDDHDKKDLIHVRVPKS